MKDINLLDDEYADADAEEAAAVEGGDEGDNTATIESLNNNDHGSGGGGGGDNRCESSSLNGKRFSFAYRQRGMMED